MKSWLIAIAAALALSNALPASAAVPRSMSYQGILTDNLGTPVADGNYSLTIRLYDAVAAGNLLFAETHPTVAVANGGFNVILGSINPLSLNFDKPLWLSLQVGVDPELSPRVELASSPYAMGLSLPFDGRANAATPTFVLRNSTGAALQTEGAIQVQNAGGATAAVEVELTTPGGRLQINDDTGVSVARLEADVTATGGGYFTISRNATFQGFIVNGNDGTENPAISILGASRSALFNMGQSGDAAVQFPSGSVNSVELLNEPGVAQSFQNASIAVGLGVTTIGSRTITVPDDGYVIAMASGHCEMGHVNGTDSRIIYGINDQTGLFASSQGVTGVPSQAPSGISYRFPLPFTGVWPVTAGAHTFYLLAQRIGAANGIVWNDPTITLLYVPTAYGTVTGNRAFGEGSAQAVGGPLDPADIDAEKNEAAAFDQARIQRELDVMKAQLDALTSRLANDSNMAPTAPQK